MDADPDPPVETQVLVVGAGPAGLTMALGLALAGIEVLLVGRRRSPSTLSRALAVSTRSMEIFRSWGLEDAIRAGAADVRLFARVARTMVDAEAVEMPLGYPTDDQAAAISPTRPAWAPQDHLEPLLLELLRGCPTATVSFGVELVALREDQGVAGTRVAATLRAVGSTSTTLVRATYGVAADGAHSALRSQLRIEMVGSDELAEFHRVEFRAPLARALAGPRCGLYVVTHPAIGGGVLAARGPDDRWGLSWEWRPGQARLIAGKSVGLVERIRIATGVPHLDVEIEQTSGFRFAAQMASAYQRSGWFLVGDAAHRMTPRGGTGMNTAIQDSYNLGWKLAWVLHGWADPSLLDTYENERRPIGQHNVSRSADPGGARRDPEDALEWDLAGRLAHCWTSSTTSTLDLVGDGLTLFTGPESAGPGAAPQAWAWRAPLSVVRLDTVAAHALRIPPGGGVLVRPDAIVVTPWDGQAPAIDTGDLPMVRDRA